MSRQSSPDRYATSPEWKLILACARTRLDDLQRSRICELLEGPLQWNALIDLAVQQRVEPLLSKHLAGEFAGSVPQEQLENLKERARAVGQWNLRLAGQVFRVLDLFQRAGLVVVPYKGPALSALAYGNLALRCSEDLDFVLPQRDVPRAFPILFEAGFRSELDPSIPRHDRFLRRGALGQYLFHAEGGIIAVELHTEKTLRYFPTPLDWDGLQARLETVLISGQPVGTFSVEDLLVMLSVHGAKHFWSRLSWICDIAELAQIPRGVDWELSEALARRKGCRRMWLLGLSLAHEMLDASIPEPVARCIRDEPGVASLTRQVLTMPVGCEETRINIAQRLRFRISSHERVADGIRQCARVATRLTEDDWSDIALPKWAEPLYAVMRPWRLFYKHSVRWRRGPAVEAAPHTPEPVQAIPSETGPHLVEQRR